MTDVLLECPKCGWVHFGVTERYVQIWEDEWVVYWNKIDEETRANFGCVEAPPKRDPEYTQCFRCGNRDRDSFFKTSKELNGHTIQGIMFTPEQEIQYAEEIKAASEPRSREDVQGSDPF